MSENRPLYKIRDDIVEILDALCEDIDEEVEQELREKLESLDASFNEKAANVIAYCKNLKADYQVFKNESDVLKAKATSIKKSYDGLMEYLNRLMRSADIPKVKEGVHSATLCSNSKPTVNIVDIDAVPTSLVKKVIEVADLDQVPDDIIIRFVGEPKVDKERILEISDEGGDVPPGVEIVLGTHVRIR